MTIQNYDGPAQRYLSPSSVVPTAALIPQLYDHILSAQQPVCNYDRLQHPMVMLP